MKNLIILSIISLFIVGCGESELSNSEAEIKKIDQEKVFPVKYWLANPELTNEKVDWCKATAERKISANCMNASNAKSLIKKAKILGTDPLAN